MIPADLPEYYSHEANGPVNVYLPETQEEIWGTIRHLLPGGHPGFGFYQATPESPGPRRSVIALEAYPPQVLEPGCAIVFTKTGDAYYVGNEDFFDGYWQEEEEK